MKTKQQPLNQSPLDILNHQFIEIHLNASENADESPLSLNFQRQWGTSDADPTQWKLTLSISFGGGPDLSRGIYQGKLTIAGYFKIADAYPEPKRGDLIKITGASILYGACREMLANLTARSSHGMLSLPSITFVESPESTGTNASSRRKSN